MQQWRKLHSKVWQSSQVMKLPLQARILYLYMISIADDHGRLKSDGALLRYAFPYDDFNAAQISGWRDLIERVGLIKVYEKDGEILASHPNWKDYQGGRGTPIRPDRKKSEIPEPNQPTANALPTDSQPTGNGLATDWQPPADTERKKEEKRKNRKERKKREIRVFDETSLTPKQITIKFFNQVEALIQSKTDQALELRTYLRDLVAKGVPKDRLWSEIKKFHSYWTEKNKTGKQQRWEMQKTFEVNRRLATWFSRISEFNKPSFVRPQYHPDDVKVN